MRRLQSVAVSYRVQRAPEFSRQNLDKDRWSICHCCRFLASNAFLTLWKLQVSLLT